MTGIFLLVACSTALHYLGSQALITRWAWSRYPLWLDTFMSCAACAGTWFSGLLALTAHLTRRQMPWAALLPGSGHWSAVLVYALVGMVLTPSGAALLRWALGGGWPTPHASEPIAAPPSDGPYR